MTAVVRATPPILRRGSPEEAGMSGARLDQISDRAREWIGEGVARGMVLLVARRGILVFHESYGQVGPEPDAPRIPLDAIFNLESAGKVITATALLILVEEGRVGLNRPVAGYIPEFAGEGKDRVLVRHLLTHTSGLLQQDVDKYARDHRGKFAVPPAEATFPQILAEFFALRYGCPLGKKPDEEMSYCSFGLDMAGEIIRRVSGEPLERFAHSRIFGPLGMKDTYCCRLDAPQERRVRRPPDPSDIPDPIDEAIETERIVLGSGSAVSTASDLAIFGQMYLNGGTYGPERVLSRASVAALTRNQIPGIGATLYDEVFPEASWGLGWSVHGSKTGFCGGLYSARAYEHWGAGGIYLWVDPDHEIVGVYLSSAPPEPSSVWRFAKYWRSDLFQDMATAAVVER